MLFRGSYQGSSFFELLQLDHRHLLPDLAAWGRSATESVPHGTTVLAMRFTNGILVAGDRLATAGHTVASRDVVKVFETDPYSVMAISGAAGPCIEMARILSVELEHYEKIEGERLELEGKANKLSQMIRANLPAAMQGLAVVPLFAGYDTRRKTGRLWKFDITGGRYEDVYEKTALGWRFKRRAFYASKVDVSPQRGRNQLGRPRRFRRLDPRAAPPDGLGAIRPGAAAGERVRLH